MRLTDHETLWSTLPMTSWICSLSASTDSWLLSMEHLPIQTWRKCFFARRVIVAPRRVQLSTGRLPPTHKPFHYSLATFWALYMFLDDIALPCLFNQTSVGPWIQWCRRATVTASPRHDYNSSVILCKDLCSFQVVLVVFQLNVFVWSHVLMKGNYFWMQKGELWYCLITWNHFSLHCDISYTIHPWYQKFPCVAFKMAKFHVRYTHCQVRMKDSPTDDIRE